jgi:hypothetical protein
LSSGEIWAVSENGGDYDNDGDGSWVWHSSSGRWTATQLVNGRTLSDIAVVPTKRPPDVVWAVGQIGNVPKNYDGYFPAHTDRSSGATAVETRPSTC